MTKQHKHDEPEFLVVMDGKTSRHATSDYRIQQRGAGIHIGETVEQAAERWYQNYVDKQGSLNPPGRVVTLYRVVKQFVPGHGENVYGDAERRQREQRHGDINESGSNGASRTE